jgi:hypothetical protein
MNTGLRICHWIIVRFARLDNVDRMYLLNRLQSIHHSLSRRDVEAGK